MKAVFIQLLLLLLFYVYGSAFVVVSFENVFVLNIYHQISRLSLKKLLLMQSLSNYWKKQIWEHSYFFFVLTWSIWSGISDLWEKHKPEAVMQLWSFTNTIPLVSDEKHKSYTWLVFTTSNLLLSSSLKDNILDTISKKQCFVWTSVFFCIFMNLNDVMPQGWNTETFWKQKYTTGGDVRQGLDWLILLVFYYSISKNFSGQSWGHQ